MWFLCFENEGQVLIGAAQRDLLDRVCGFSVHQKMWPQGWIAVASLVIHVTPANPILREA